MKAHITLTTSNKYIEHEILQRCLAHVTNLLNLSAPSIRTELKSVIHSIIANDEVYQSLMDGRLRGHMGLENPESVLPAIITKIADSMKVWVDKPRIVGKQIEGGLQVGILKSDFLDILGLPGTSYISPPSGRNITWLSWMLFDGMKVVILNHGIKFALTQQERQASRSKMALMYTGGGGWHVPHFAAGTSDDNFLTRAFETGLIYDEINTIIRHELERRM